MNCFRMTAFRFSKIEISYCEVFYCEKSRCLKIWNLPIYVQLNVRWFIWCVFLYEDLNWQNVRCFLTSIWIFYVFSDEKCDAFRESNFLAALRTLVLLRLKRRFKADVTEKMATRSRQDLENKISVKL